jgi:branched-chain amino acid transport system ATP-binding protein
VSQTSNNDAALRAEGLTVAYGGVYAIQDVTMTVATGSTHAVIGPNGAGKTTMINSITGFAPLRSGRVWHNGRSIEKRPSYDIASGGLVRTFQNLATFGELTVEQSLLLGRHVASRAGWLACGLNLPKATREKARQRVKVREVAARLSLDHVLDEPAVSLSYGDRKRVELARALCLEPSVLLLDEPVAGMNPTEKYEMVDTLKAAKRDFNLTIILIEHDMGTIVRLADKITVLDFGKVIAEGSPVEIQANPDVIEAYLGTHGKELLAAEGHQEPPS